MMHLNLASSWKILGYFKNEVSPYRSCRCVGELANHSTIHRSFHSLPCLLSSSSRKKRTKRLSVSKLGKTPDYYNVLKINDDANENEVKTAYFKLSKKYHPDLNQDKDAAEKFRQINEAYDVLGSKDARRRYDTLIFGEDHLHRENPLKQAFESTFDEEKMQKASRYEQYWHEKRKQTYQDPMKSSKGTFSTSQSSSHWQKEKNRVKYTVDSESAQNEYIRQQRKADVEYQASMDEGDKESASAAIMKNLMFVGAGLFVFVNYVVLPVYDMVQMNRTHIFRPENNVKVLRNDNINKVNETK